MTKSKTIIATLGIVAGLGAAALPLTSYATQTQQSVSGNVDLYVEVQPAIAMSITGNNDTNTYYGTQYDDNDTPEDTSDDTPSDNAAVHVKNPSGASTINGQNVSSYEVGAATKASSSYLSILPNTKIDGNDTNNFKSTITVYTNSTSGYVLNIKDANSDLALNRITTTQDTTADSIPAKADFAVGTDAGWAYKAGEGSYAAITASDAAITTKNTKTSGGDATVVYYGVATKADQATGVYTDTITYTATTR